jgi:hypothetical protein
MRLTVVDAVRGTVRQSIAMPRPDWIGVAQFREQFPENPFFLAWGA